MEQDRISRMKLKIRANKKKLLAIVSPLITVYLALASILFLTYLVAPLIGGKLSFKALMIYGSWIGSAILLKYIIKNFQKETLINNFKYFLICLYFISCMFLWFPYPLSLLSSLTLIVGFAVGYKKRRRPDPSK